MSVWRTIRISQWEASAWFDRSFLSPEWRADAGGRFEEIARAHLHSRDVVVDVGGGKQPFLSPQQKQAFALTVVGLDIDERELGAAPPGAYDRVICADITSYKGAADADLIICAGLLEHVQSTAAAISAMHSILKPGGVALLYLPSRNALYARLNLLLPEDFKRRLLSLIWPERRGCGFPVYYDACTPRDLAAIGEKAGFSVESLEPYWYSGYFCVTVVTHVLWRMTQGVLRALWGTQAAESFIVVLRKQ